MDFLAWPRIDPEYARAERDPRRFWRAHVPSVVAFGVLLALPPVRRLTGADPLPVALAIGAHLLMYGTQVFAAASDRYPRGFALLASTVNAVVSALPAATTARPWTPLWLLYFMYPLIAASAFGWNAVVLAVFVATPFAVAFLPWSLVGAVSLPDSLPGAVTLAASIAATYAILATQADSARRIRGRERDAERTAAAEAERRRVAHDLHATIGAALSEVALWHDVAARADGPQAAQAVARARERAREALSELRTTVQGLGGGAVAPEALEGRLRRRLAGLADAAGVALALSVRGDAPVPAMRAYHLQKLVEEAALNAIRHARASRVEIDVTLDPLRASIVDDGGGFDPAAAPAGHGLGALAAHAAALGVPLALRAAPGRGTEVAAGAPATGRVA